MSDHDKGGGGGGGGGGGRRGGPPQLTWKLLRDALVWVLCGMTAFQIEMMHLEKTVGRVTPAMRREAMAFGVLGPVALAVQLGRYVNRELVGS